MRASSSIMDYHHQAVTAEWLLQTLGMLRCVPAICCPVSFRAPRREDPVGAWSHSTTTLSGPTWGCPSTRCQCWPSWGRRPTPSATRWGLLLSIAGGSQRRVSKPRALLMLMEREATELSFCQNGNDFMELIHAAGHITCALYKGF